MHTACRMAVDNVPNLELIFVVVNQIFQFAAQQNIVHGLVGEQQGQSRFVGGILENLANQLQYGRNAGSA